MALQKKQGFFSVKTLLIILTFLFFFIMVFLPLALVIHEGFNKGVAVYLESIKNDEVKSAIKLTLIAASVSVILNTTFGLSTAWFMTKFKFKGKTLYNTLLDIPFSISPVIVGLMFVVLLGRNSKIGQILEAHDIKIIFALPGIILVTVFVTLPFIAKELIPLMQEQGKEEEEAALSLGASGWKTFLKVTLPNIKWGLLYGIILCSARAVGEFGAVSVVSGHIRGETNTIPLHVEILYNEYEFTAAFAVATILVAFAIVTLIVKTIIERKYSLELKK
jgi:sulfate ABC transporter, permease protein CysW